MTDEERIILQIAKNLKKIKCAKNVLVYPYGGMGKLTGNILNNVFDIEFIPYDRNFNGGG